MKTQSAPHPVRLTLPFVPLALTLLLAGCLSKPALRPQRFAFTNPPVTTAPSKGDHVLAIRSCEVSPTFSDRWFAYRTGPHTYELDSYAGFMVRPGRALEIPICGHLRNSGLFKDVFEGGSPLTPDVMLDIHISELYGDFRDPEKTAAVLSMQLRFFTVEKGKPEKLLLQKDCARRITLGTETAAAVVAGWDTALAEIMAEVVADLKAHL